MFFFFSIFSLCKDLNFTAIGTYEAEVSPSVNQTFQSNVVIPSQTKILTKQYNVVSIGEYAFNESSVTQVEFPNTLTHIKNYAFYKCYSLQKIDFSNTKLQYIGKYAFGECIDLTQVIFPKTISNIDDFAFYYCEKLSTIDLQNAQIRIIGNSSFASCSSLSEIFVPPTLFSIGDYAFSKISISSFDFPPVLKSLGAGAFVSAKFTSVDLSDTLITELQDEVFFDCFYLESITFPLSLKSIGNNTFANNKALKAIDLSYTIVTHIGDYCFAGCSSATILKLSPAIKVFGNVCFEQVKNTTFTMPSTVTFAGDYFMKDNTALISVDLSQSKLFLIPEGSFVNCTNLNSIKWPKQEFDIGSYAFSRTSISDINLPPYVGDIFDYCFSECMNIKEVNISLIPHSFTGSHIFYKCENLEKIVIQKSRVNLPPYFLSHTKIGSFNTTENIVSIGKGCFSYCPNIKNVSLLNSSISILDDYVFKGNNMTLLLIPDFVNTIGLDAIAENTEYVVYYGSYVPNFGSENEIKRVIVPNDYRDDYFCGVRVTRVSHDELGVVFSQELHFTVMFLILGIFITICVIIFYFQKPFKESKFIHSLEQDVPYE